MAQYPQFSSDSDGFSILYNDGREVDRASDGSIRIRNTYPRTQEVITLVHPALRAEEFKILEDFYYSNKNNTVQWTDPVTNTNYDLLFLSKPSRSSVRGRYIRATSILEGVRIEG